MTDTNEDIVTIEHLEKINDYLEFKVEVTYQDDTTGFIDIYAVKTIDGLDILTEYQVYLKINDTEAKFINDNLVVFIDDMQEWHKKIELHLLTEFSGYQPFKPIAKRIYDNLASYLAD